MGKRDGEENGWGKGENEEIGRKLGKVCGGREFGKKRKKWGKIGKIENREFDTRKGIVEKSEKKGKKTRAKGV